MNIVGQLGKHLRSEDMMCCPVTFYQLMTDQKIIIKETFETF